jgi:peroxiredoxin (alkyl hydroperoxide reductase subunit C)
MSAFVSAPAPDFSGEAYLNGEFKKISLSDFKGKKVVLFFYPLDFTFVCPTEIVAFTDKMEEFRKRNTEVVGVSVDSKFTHKAWAETERKDGGIKGVNYPLLSDINKKVAADYGVLLPADGIALRGLFIINKDGILKHATINHLDLGRNVDEVLRLLDAVDFSEQHGEVCPANWKKGEKAMKPTAESLKQYMSKG